MSQENVEIALRIRDAFNSRDLIALAEMCDDDVEFVSFLAAVDAGGATYRGTGFWDSYFARMDESWGDWQVEDARVFDAGDDRVAAVFRLVGAGKSSGVPVDQTVGMAIRFRNGKVWRMRSYPNGADALEAVGLSEQDAHADS